MKPIKQSPAFPAFDNIFQDFFGRGFFDDDRFVQRSPAVNIKQDEQGFGLELAIPGVKKEDVKIELEGRHLKISSEVRQEDTQTDAQGHYTRREFGLQAFSRVFTLPETIDTEQIEAKFAQGVLHISLPKLVEAQKVNKLIDIA